ncbi:MAG: hypothetical protein IPJ81_08095 [Chitinophagaceae bacterium]|nr:hypothetical protein [Chitinophagaceae bacterium]
MSDFKDVSFNDNDHNRQLYTGCCITDGIEMANPKVKEVRVTIKAEKAALYQEKG